MNGNLEHCFIEMSACKGSCIGGPAMEHVHPIPISGYLAVDGLAGSNDFPVKMPESSSLAKAFPHLHVRAHRPGKSTIEEALRRMVKTRPADELNCGSCGYNTCRDKAVRRQGVSKTAAAGV